ncbi:MAG TPA: HAD-IA family hydrolase [Chloroflexota bacterium]|nr:HAD-IA family hydrolase [Chloroflexota bacterium]
MRFTTVLFDVGDTLVNVPRPAPTYQRLLAEHGCVLAMPEVERIVQESRRVVDELVPTWLGDDLSLDAAATARRRELHVETILSLAGVADASAARSAFFDLYVGTRFFTLFPDVPDALRALQERGYRMGIVSNWESRLMSLCAAHGIADAFDFAVVSELEGYVKPHARLYRRALELAGVPPERVVHVGDKVREDVGGAASVGIAAVLLDRQGQSTGDYQPRISSLAELPSLLDSFAAASSSDG